MATTDISPPTSISEAFLASINALPDGERFKVCIQCGTCSGICPFGMWMDYTPRKMILALKMNEFEKVLDTETVWMCVSCYACTENCPQEIPLTASLMTRAKEELIFAENIPEELQTAFENTQRYGNPIGESPERGPIGPRD